jgi:putative intracellular protease/amidase
MKTLFLVTGSENYAWMSEVTHPFWHLFERGVEIDFATPKGSNIFVDPSSDPFTKGSAEPDDLVSKGFLSDKVLAGKLEKTARLKDVDLSKYDAVHAADGLGAVFDLYPNADVAAALEHCWANDKVIGAICHGSIALANNADRIRGRHVAGYTREEDRELEFRLGDSVKIPHFPQEALENAGAKFEGAAPHKAFVVQDGKPVTGQNQFSASDYGIVLCHTILGSSPVHNFRR